MSYRTKTYIAGDWDGDKEAIEKIYQWNNSKYWGLSFHDAHELTSARDSSLPCSIKKSLALRLDVSKTFVLVVGEHTNSLTKGGCQLCDSYNSWTKACARWHNVDTRSFIKYECEKAVNDGLKIVVLYNSSSVNRDKCPEIVRYKGKHIAMRHYNIYGFDWDYQAIKDAIMY